MKELLTQYAAYNIWANGQFIKLIVGLTEQQQQQEVTSSFPSLYKTMLHIWDAESIVWQRIKLQEHIVPPSATPGLTMEHIIEGWQHQSKLWVDWVASASNMQLEHVFAYQNSKREQFKQSVWQMLQHVFNHGSYHRGQLATMLRQLGIDTIPQTDFLIWVRSKK